MIALSKKIFCALEAVLYIASRVSTHPVSSREIAEKHDLPPRYLEQIMQKLVHGGILRGVRGPNGGYLLAKERRKLSLGDICAILMEEEEKEAPLYSSEIGERVLAPIWDGLRNEMITRLQQFHFADLCEKAERITQTQTKGPAEKMDFMI